MSECARSSANTFGSTADLRRGQHTLHEATIAAKHAARDTRYLKRVGYTWDEFKPLRGKAQYLSPTDHTPYGRYMRFRINHTKRCTTPFNLTFREWWECWQASGKWELCGRGTGHYAMRRVDVTKPWQADNIEIVTWHAALALTRKQQTEIYYRNEASE